MIHGLVWQKTPAFSLYPGGYVEISPSSTWYREYAGCCTTTPCGVASRSATLVSARAASPSSRPTPASTHMPCGSTKICPSSFSPEPIGLPWKSYARRNHSPSQPCSMIVPVIFSAAARYSAAFSPSPRRSATLASSLAASTNCPAMKTDSACPPVTFSVVWNGSPGVSEKQLRFRQSFQSARPISGSPCGPSRPRVYSSDRVKCS